MSFAECPTCKQIVFETIVTVKDRSITQAEQLESTARHKTDLFLKENLGTLVDSLAVAPAGNDVLTLSGEVQELLLPLNVIVTL